MLMRRRRKEGGGAGGRRGKEQHRKKRRVFFFYFYTAPMHHRKGYQMKRKEAAGRPLFSTAVGRCVFQSLDGISSRVISLYCSSLEGDQSTELQRCNYTLGALSTGGQRRALPSMAIAARSEKKRCKSRIVLRRNKGTNAADELARQENTKTSNSPQRFTLSHCLVRGSTQCPARL